MVDCFVISDLSDVRTSECINESTLAACVVHEVHDPCKAPLLTN